MDKQKLLRIIIKDLEELKFLSEEITENEGDSSLVIDLALSKAKLLCQEIEVLKEISAPFKKQAEEEQIIDDELEEEIQEEGEENETMDVADPELEILNFETPEFQEEIDEEEVAEVETKDEEMPVDFEEEADDETEDAGTDADEAEDLDPEPEQAAEETDEDFEAEFEEESDDDLIEDSSEDDLEEEPEAEFEEPSLEDEVEEEVKVEFREITLDDDDEIETIQIPTNPTIREKPVFREIPKPEEPILEKTVIGETFQKERSLNDVAGETKSTESKISSGPIANLRAAIGLNDRFLFIREIFDNNTEKYNTVIENLDKLETIQQAVEYLKANLSLQKNETSMKFVELLKRRFTK